VARGLTKDQLPLLSASLNGITDEEAKKDQRLCLYLVVKGAGL
jgi:hypothetical protein